MKRVPMTQEGRLKAAERHRRRSRAGKATVVVLAAVTAGLWTYLFLQS